MSDESEVIVRREPLEPKPVKIPTTKDIREGYECIILEENDAIPPTGQPISLNGKAYVLRAGEEAWVPPGVLEVLDHAVMNVPQVDAQTRKVIGYRPKLRFPYRHVKNPARAKNAA